MRNSLAVLAILVGLLLGVGLGNTIFVFPTPSISTEPRQAPVPESTLSEVTIELVSTEILQEVNAGTTSTASFIGDFTGIISGAFVAEFFFTIESYGKVPIASYAITKDPHGIDKNGLASFTRRLTDQEMVEIVSAINLFRYNRDDSCPFTPSSGVELFLKKVPSSRVCLSCSVRY